MTTKHLLRTSALAAVLFTVGASAYGGPADVDPEARAGDAADGAPEGSIVAGPTVTVQAGWWGPVVVKGKLFNNEGEGTATVSVYDGGGALLAKHTVRPTIGYCNSHGACWDGGAFSTSFSVTEIGAALHAVCATIRVTAYDNVLEVGAPSVDTFLPSCLN